MIMDWLTTLNYILGLILLFVQCRELSYPIQFYSFHILIINLFILNYYIHKKYSKKLKKLEWQCSNGKVML